MSKFDNEKDGRLVELYREHREDLECLGNSSHQNKRRRNTWNHITQAINNENRTNFTWEQCKKRWQNIKSVAKATNAANKRSFFKTGGGPQDRKPLSDTTNKVLDFLGETAGFQGCYGGVETPLNSENSPAVSNPVLLNESEPLPETKDSQPCKPKLAKVKSKPKITDEELREKQMEVRYSVGIGLHLSSLHAHNFVGFI